MANSQDRRPATQQRERAPRPDNRYRAARNTRQAPIPFRKMTDARTEKEMVKYPFTYHYNPLMHGWVIDHPTQRAQAGAYLRQEDCAAAVHAMNLANAKSLGYTIIG